MFAHSTPCRRYTVQGRVLSGLPRWTSELQGMPAQNGGVQHLFRVQTLRGLLKEHLLVARWHYFPEDCTVLEVMRHFV